jgi:hypothetical protein
MKVKVLVCKDYSYTIPATEIVITSFNGEVTTIPTPEKVFTYKIGDKLTFGTKKDAQRFCKAHSGIFSIDK